MKIKFLSLLLLLTSHFLVLNSVFPQTFQRTYGNTGSQTGTCIQPTLDGNYIISAMATGLSYSDDFMLMKINTAGGLLWKKTYGGTLSERPYYVSACTDGGYIMSGSTNSFGAGGADVYLVRTDSDGNLLWSKTVGGSSDDIGWFVVQMSDGGFITCGGTKSFGGPTWNGYLIKNDSDGNLLWTKVFNGTGGEFFNGMSKTSDGGVIVTGYTSTNSFGSSDIWLVKTDFNGDTLWTKQYGKVTEDAGWAVIETADGGYAITGDMHKDTITPGAHRTVLLKTNSAGNMQWANLYGSNPGSEVGYDLRQTPDNGYVVLGNTGYYGQGSKDILLFRTDSVGLLKWGRAYGSVMQDDAWQFRKTADEGNIIIAATENFSANTNWDIYLVQTDSLGQDSCFESSVTPEVFTPFLQERSGINIVSGGVLGNPSTVTNTPTMLVGNPCMFLSVTTSQTNVSCFGGNDAAATVNPAGGNPPYTYFWNPTAATTATATGLSAGTYTVTVTDATASSTLSTVAITQPPDLLSTMSVTNASSCSASDGSATANVSGGTLPYTYLWNPSGAATAIATGLSADTFYVTVTDANGCTLSDTAVVSCPNAISQPYSLNKFSVYPNPTTGVFTIQMNNLQCVRRSRVFT